MKQQASANNFKRWLSQFSNSITKRPVRETVSTSHLHFWNLRQYFRRAFCPKRGNDEANHGFAPYEEGQCSQWHIAWPNFIPHLWKQVKTARKKKSQTAVPFHWWPSDKTTYDKKNNHSLCWSYFGMEDTRLCDTSEEYHGNIKLADFPLSFNNIWQKDSGSHH